VRVSPPTWITPRNGPDVYGPCIESVRPAISRIINRPPCEMVEVFLDGVSIGLAPDLLMNLPMMDVESIEFLHPLQAARWGYDASLYGALVIWTRGRGPHARRER
jgi:hypothetical protein